MNKILIRATPSPLDTYTPEQVWSLNTVHNNMGNVAFPFGLFRNLTTETTEVVSDWYGAKLPDPEVVNAEYDAYILPMANDFGSHFVGEMERLTNFINKLTIPVVVVGIGGAFADENPDFSKPRPYDETSKRFIDAVLNHSSRLGLRGAITGKYLESLGYKEGEHFQVIGDPTLYNFGPKLHIRDFNLSDESKIAFNMTPTAPEGAVRFLNGLPERFNNINYVPQDLAEFSKIYAGQMTLGGKALRDELDYFPNNFDDIVYRDGKIKWFMSAPSWIDFMKDVDLSIGTRIHGNILPTAAGVPTLTMTFGARLRELTEFHHLPRIDAKSVRADMSLEQLIEGVDFHEPEYYHEENFNNFVKFMDDNGLHHLYRENETSNIELPFDTQLKKIDLLPPVTPINQLTDIDEIQQRIKFGYEMTQNALVRVKKRDAKTSTELRNLRKQVKELETSVKKTEQQTVLKSDTEVWAEKHVGKDRLVRQNMPLYNVIDSSTPIDVVRPGEQVFIEALVADRGQLYFQVNGLFTPVFKGVVMPIRDNLNEYLTQQSGKVSLRFKQGAYKSVDFSDETKSEVLDSQEILTVEGVDWTLGGTPRLKTNKGYISANKRNVKEANGFSLKNRVTQMVKRG